MWVSLPAATQLTQLYSENSHPPLSKGRTGEGVTIGALEGREGSAEAGVLRVVGELETV